MKMNWLLGIGCFDTALVRKALRLNKNACSNMQQWKCQNLLVVRHAADARHKWCKCPDYWHKPCQYNRLAPIFVIELLCLVDVLLLKHFLVESPAACTYTLLTKSKILGNDHSQSVAWHTRSRCTRILYQLSHTRLICWALPAQHLPSLLPMA